MSKKISCFQNSPSFLYIAFKKCPRSFKVKQGKLKVAEAAENILTDTEIRLEVYACIYFTNKSNIEQQFDVWDMCSELMGKYLWNSAKMLITDFLSALLDKKYYRRYKHNKLLDLVENNGVHPVDALHVVTIML